MNTVRDRNRDIDPERVSLKGKARRMIITLTTKALWQVAGVLLGRGGEQETYSAEPFGGIGLAARPPSSGKPEAIVLMLGNDGKTPVIVAIRDEKTRAAVAGAIAEDETMTFNSKVCSHHKADGTIELRNATPAGTIEKMVKGETYRTAEDTMLTAMSTCLTAISTYALAIKPIADPTNVATPALTAAITAMIGAITAFKGAAATYLATVGKVE